MALVGISSKGQILVPKSLRDKYGIKTSGKIILEETKKGLLIKPITKEYISSLRGIFSDAAPGFEERQRWKKEDLEKEDKN